MNLTKPEPIEEVLHVFEELLEELVDIKFSFCFYAKS